MKTLSVIIPVYNEEKTILEIVNAVKKCQVSGLEKEIIIVDDASTDGTREILKKLEGCNIIFQSSNQGKGAALRRGFSAAKGDIILVQDADMEYDPNEYENLIQPLLSGKADVVYGSRFMGDKPHRALFFWHYLGNKFLTVFSNIFTNINLTDMETCYKVFTKKALEAILPHLCSDRFGIEPEITAVVASKGLRIYEVGISYAGRTYEEGKKIGWKDGISALWTIVATRIRLSKDRYKLVLPFLIIGMVLLSIFLFQPKVEGDSVSYAEGINFLRTGDTLPGFTPYRILTTMLGMRFIMMVDFFFGNLLVSWHVANSILMMLLGMFFYFLSKKIFGSRTAFLMTILLVFNYATVSFGSAYLMDVGGWAFYVMFIYAAYAYLKKGSFATLLLSSALLSVGGLFKECAFPAVVALIGVIVWRHRKEWKRVFALSAVVGFIVFTPVFLLNIYTWEVYNYTYLSWMISAQSVYVYKSRIIEYIKAFGSLYNFGWFIFLPGLYLFAKKWRAIIAKGEKSEKEEMIFISLVALSGLSVLVWAAITQRILFISVPALVFISGFFIKKMENQLIIILPIIVLYILSGFLMDSYLLKVINI